MKQQLNFQQQLDKKHVKKKPNATKKIETVKTHSKKIQKETKASKFKVQKQKPKRIKLEINDLNEFLRQNNGAYQKIRKRTIQLLKVLKYINDQLTFFQLDKELIKKASKSLIKFYSSRRQKKLIKDKKDDYIQVEIKMNNVPIQYNLRPIQIHIPNPIISEDFKSKICIIVQDPVKNFQDKLEEIKIPCLSKIIGFAELLSNHKSIKDKLALCSQYDQFYCDHRIYDNFMKSTGVAFLQKKKIPYPIDIETIPQYLQDQSKNQYSNYINQLQEYTYFVMSNGPLYHLKVARIPMQTKDIVKNIIHSIYNTVPYLIKQNIKHSRVENIYIKCQDSPSLPIYEKNV